jgi:hypothetical protein
MAEGAPRQQHYRLTVEGHDAITSVVEFDASNITEFRANLLQAKGTAVDKDVHVEFEDPDFGEYVLLTELNGIDDSTRIRISVIVPPPSEQVRDPRPVVNALTLRARVPVCRTDKQGFEPAGPVQLLARSRARRPMALRVALRSNPSS